MQSKLKDILKIPLFFAAFVLLGLTFGFITFKILSFSRTVEVPELVNMTLLEANDKLNRNGLYLKIEGEDFDNAVQAGKIMRQDIPSGKKVKEQRSIKVVVSKGPRVYSIPLLVNETVGSASDLLIQKGLRIGRVLTVHSDSVEKGKIIAQKPEPDEKLTDVITVLVSAGPHELTYTCPDFVQKTVSDAKALADKMAIILDVRGEGSIVSFQKPKPGIPIKSGDTVHLETAQEPVL